jgi:hypothetical protein
MGTPKYGVDTAGDQEVAQELIPVEGVGPVRAMPYDAWKNGIYCTDDLTKDHPLPSNLIEWGTAATSTTPLPDISKPVTCQAVPEGRMRELMDEYVNLKNKWGTKLPNVVGILTVSDNQLTSNQAGDNTQPVVNSDLKRIDVRIVWNIPELDANGQVQKDGNGQPKTKIANRVVDDKGTKADAPAIQDSGKQVFVDRLSDYHNNGG